MEVENAGVGREHVVSQRLLTIPNVLSVLRLLGVPLFLWAIVSERDGLALLVLIAIRDPGRIDSRSRTVRRLTVGLIAVMTVGTLAAVVVLVHDILVTVPGVSGATLLARGGAVWFTNVNW